ncbi:MAG: SDR family oxidoreductase [Paracoccus sp. (in: a-proteobacteria)]|uniref:SDR family oxidoreductase n=1 Tax=Paracoccus sp. TaxID=267 RepID=UPI00391BDABB
MDIEGRTALVTGAAAGIGAALARALADAGARRVVCADRDEGGAARIAASIGGVGLGADMGRDGDIARMIDMAEDQAGPIDLYCGNAGIIRRGGIEVPDADWQTIWDVNVMAHIRATRILLPQMIARGGGHVMITASAAGLLSQVGAAPYAVTKHAAVGFAEWLALTHGDDGIGVTLLCPQAVRTAMTEGREAGVASIDGMMEADAVAAVALEALREGRFLALPHPEVATYMRRKTDDYDRWIGGMQRLNRHYTARPETPGT